MDRKAFVLVACACVIGCSSERTETRSEPDAGPTACAACSLEVEYTCRGNGASQVDFQIGVRNNAADPISLADVRIHYWYTDDLLAQIAECDYAPFDCANVVRAFDLVSPPRPGANLYFELGFVAGAGMVAGHDSTQPTWLRLHSGADYAPIDQRDDYSFDCSMMGTPVAAPRITAYLRGTLAWGVEPPQ